MKKGLFVLIIAIGLLGCNKNLRGTSSNKAIPDINSVPETFEPGFDLEKFNPKKSPVEVRPDQDVVIQDLPKDDQLPPDSSAEENKNKPGATNPSEGSDKKNQTQKTNVIKTSVQASRIIFFAQKVIETEARKLGTACNRFISRVLALSGFSNSGFIANDFDLYANKNFSHARVVNFRIDNNGDSLQRLKIHLWSYPERTPFILQWTRVANHGHVAFLERIGDKLVIYQASLNSQFPNKKQTLVQALINKHGRENLTVYSEMTPTTKSQTMANN